MLAVMLLFVTVNVGAQPSSSSKSQSSAPEKRPTRTAQPIEERGLSSSMITNDSPFGLNRAGFYLEGENKTDEEIDTPDPEIEMSYQLDWTNYQWHRVGSDDPLQAVLTGTFYTNHPMVWNLYNADGELDVLDELTYVHNLYGGEEAIDSLELDWEIRVDGGPWRPLHSQNNYGFHIPIAPGDHVVQLRVSSLMPLMADEGYYRLTLAQRILPQL